MHRSNGSMASFVGKGITAVIPVRAGSRRLKNKNVAPFAGTNLLLYKIEQLKKVSSIEEIVVTSDSDMMLAMAKKAGVHTHKRAPEFCDETTKSFGEVVRHVAENVGGGGESISYGLLAHHHWYFRKSMNKRSLRIGML